MGLVTGARPGNSGTASWRLGVSADMNRRGLPTTPCPRCPAPSGAGRGGGRGAGGKDYYLYTLYLYTLRSGGTLYTTPPPPHPSARARCMGRFPPARYPAPRVPRPLGAYPPRYLRPLCRSWVTRGRYLVGQVPWGARCARASPPSQQNQRHTLGLVDSPYLTDDPWWSWGGVLTAWPVPPPPQPPPLDPDQKRRALHQLPTGRQYNRQRALIWSILLPTACPHP